MFYLVYGEDSYRSQQKLMEIKQNLNASSEMVDVNTSLFDGKEVTVDQLKAACDVPPFLCSSRLVIVRGLLGLFEPSREDKELSERAQKKVATTFDQWKILENYIPIIPATTLLVFFDGDLKTEKGKNPLLKIVEPLATKVLRFSALSGSDLQSWIQTRVRECGGTITMGAVRLLTDLVGNDLWFLHNEIDKLLCCHPERCIAEGDVHQLTSYTREIKIFDLVDAILEHNTLKSQRLLHRSFLEGISAMGMLTMVTRQFRLMLRSRELLARKMTETEIGAVLRLKPYPLKKTLIQARGYSSLRVNNAYHKLLDTDIALKTSKYSDELAMELLITDICSS